MTKQSKPDQQGAKPLDSQQNSQQDQQLFAEQTISSKPIYKGKVISLQVDTVTLPNGGTSTREIVRHPGGVSVLALLRWEDARR